MSGGIYINAPMPEEGKYIHFCVHGDGKVITDYTGGWKVYKAISVPDHGRLVDADALLMRINHEVMEAYMDGVCYGVHPSQEYLYLLGEIIDDAPTVIPASRMKTAH